MINWQSMCKRYNVYLFVWETFEVLYEYTGIRWNAPIEYVWPDFSPWLWSKMTRALEAKGLVRHYRNAGRDKYKWHWWEAV
jgi:hypothetical protein